VQKNDSEQAEEREAIAKSERRWKLSGWSWRSCGPRKRRREAATINAEPEGNLSGFVTVSEAREADDSKEQLILVCDALFYIKLPESLGKYRGRVKSILTETIEEIRGLAE
jgi:hypothetical protein